MPLRLDGYASDATTTTTCGPVGPRTLASRGPNNASLLAPVPKRWHPGIGALIFSSGSVVARCRLDPFHRTSAGNAPGAACRERPLRGGAGFYSTSDEPMNSWCLQQKAERPWRGPKAASPPRRSSTRPAVKADSGSVPSIDRAAAARNGSRPPRRTRTA
jgi:hypothetical protein